jgi:Flp pilus assembly pilin Flp
VIINLPAAHCGNGDKIPVMAKAFNLLWNAVSKRRCFFRRPGTMNYLSRLWREDDGQDIAEYAVMLAVILVIVVGTIRLIGSNANNVFSNVASSIQ